MSGEFGDFEQDFAKVDKAAAGGGSDLTPEGVYKVVCSHQDVKGDGKLVDHEVIQSKQMSKGLKIFLEVLEPAVMKVGKEEVKTKGRVIEHVFWVTQKNLAYIKRDAATILGRDLKTINELTTTPWVGSTCEIGIKHEMYNGFKNEKVSFFNAWKPQKEQAKKEETKATAPTGAATTPDF